MLNFAKCVTNGVFPLGGVVCREHIYQAFLDANADAPDHTIELMHGYTYSGHPVACAAAMATLALFKEENLFERAGQMGVLLGNAMHSALKGLPHVIGIRTLGLAGAVELASVPGAAGKRAYDIFLDCYQRGVLVRSAGDNIVLCPPYIVSAAQIEQMVGTLASSIQRHA
jgi:beta-alanine--pyruvate transaminase